MKFSKIFLTAALAVSSMFGQFTFPPTSGGGGGGSVTYATDAECAAGTITNEACPPSGVNAAKGFLPSATSTALTVAAGTVSQHDILTAIDQTVATLAQINVTGITTGSTTLLTLASAPAGQSFTIGYTIGLNMLNSGCNALNGVHTVTDWPTSTTVRISTNTSSGCTPTATSGVYAHFGANASASGTVYACVAAGTITFVHPAAAGMYITGTGDFVQRQETTPSCHPTTAGVPEVGWKTVATISLATTSNGTYNTASLDTSRATIDTFDFLPGTGLTCSYTSGVLTCATSTDVVRKSADTAITGAWDASASSTTKPVKAGSSDPATCTANVGELFYNTTSDVLKHCSATNTWSAVGTSGGSFFISQPFGSCNGTGGTAYATLWSSPAHSAICTGGGLAGASGSYAVAQLYAAGPTPTTGWVWIAQLPSVTISSITFNLTMRNKVSEAHNIGIKAGCYTAGDTSSSAPTLSETIITTATGTTSQHFNGTLTTSNCASGRAIVIQLLNYSTNTGTPQIAYLQSFGLTINY